MRTHRQVTRFSPIKKSILPSLKQLNQCRQINQQSTPWKIFVSAGKHIFPPEDMIDVVSDVALHRLPHQQMIIFESETEAFVALCQVDFIPTVIKMADNTDSDKIYAYVKKLAPALQR